MNCLSSSISGLSYLSNGQPSIQTTTNRSIFPNNLRFPLLVNKPCLCLHPSRGVRPLDNKFRGHPPNFKPFASSGNGDIGIGSGGGTGGYGGGHRWSSGGGDESSDDKKDTGEMFMGKGRYRVQVLMERLRLQVRELNKRFKLVLQLVGLFVNGWRSRVQADPLFLLNVLFPFMVLKEQLGGGTAYMLRDMAHFPNIGLNGLVVFSQTVGGSILAPTAISSASSGLPSIFAIFPKIHIFELGAFSQGTSVYKGVLFAAAVGIAAGLVGTALCNGLIAMMKRKKMNLEFETLNKPLSTLLNARLRLWGTSHGFEIELQFKAPNI